MKTISRLKMMLVLVLLGWASVANAQSTENWSGTIGPKTYTNSTTVTLTGNVTLMGTITVKEGTLTINTNENYTIKRGDSFHDILFCLDRYTTATTGGNLVINGGNYRITIDGNRSVVTECWSMIGVDEIAPAGKFRPTITLTNVTLQNNVNRNGVHGSGIKVMNAKLTCTNCTFYNLECESVTNSGAGGAIYAASCEVILDKCTVSQCKSLSYLGGAVFLQQGSLTVRNNCQFTQNEGQSGAAIGCVGSTSVSISNTTFTNNTLVQSDQGSAGAFLCAGCDNVVVMNSSFSGNKGAWSAGAIDSQYCTCHFENLTFTNNEANGSLSGSYAGYGGAIMSRWDDMTITNCSFTGNKALSAGGAIFASDGTTVMTDCTVSGNKANPNGSSHGDGGNGGGIFIDFPHAFTMIDSDVINNTARAEGGGIYKIGNITMGGLIHVDNNTKGTSSTVSNTYIDNYSDTGMQYYVRIHADGLDCGSDIGITKTPSDHVYETDDVYGGVRTDIARGTQANCDYAFRNHFFFDDTDKYHVHNLAQGQTNPYANGKLYFISSWYTYTPEATVNVDYKVSSGFVTEVMTAKGLAYFAWDVNNNHDYAGKTVKQTADIDLADHYWEPIGIKEYGDCSTNYHPFKGTFDGQGYVIRNVRSILPYDAMGFFGYVDGGTITRTFIESGSFEATGSRTVGIGGLVGRLLNGATVTYSEARVNIKQTATATMGGLVGLVDGNSTIHSSMTMSSLINNGVTGGLVGQMTAGSTLKNAFSNDVYTLTGTSYAGGLVGINAGTVANCYANDTRNANSIASTVNFGWLAGQNTGTFQYCYAPNSTYNYTAATGGTNTEPGHFTAAESLNGKYKYNQYDQKVTDGGTTHKPTEGKVNLLGYLNHWVSGDYASWTRTLSSPINTDYPVPMLPTFACAGSTDGIFIWYSPTLDAMTTRYNALDGGGSVYLYSAQEDVSVNNDSDVNIYIGENIGITQTDANTLQSAHVGVTFDNSDGSSLGGANYDWHMFATPLSNASMGLTYSNAYLNIDNSTWGDNGVWPHDPPAGSLTIGRNCYFPSDTPYGAPHTSTGSFDFYCFSEPYYHWVNFKRHSNDHWHHDGDSNHNHASLDYGDYNAAGTWVNGNETTMIPAKGYMMAVDKETTLINSGTLNNGTVTRKVTHSTLEAPMSSLEGCNLIGNPYQSYLDFDEFASINGINTYYILDADEHGYAAYTVGQTEVYTGDEMTEPRYIHPHQGFFVQVAADKTLSFNKTMRKPRGRANSYFRDEEVPAYPLVRLTVGDSDGNNDYVTIELDRPEQGGGAKAKGLHTGNGIIYAHLDDGNDYHVAFTESGMESIPVRFEAFDNDVFTLRWKTMNADFSYLHLIDNLTGIDMDCLTTDKYCFEGTPGDYASRFRLEFKFTGVEENEEDSPSTGSEPFAFMMGDELIVNGDGLLQLFDLHGHLLFEKVVSGPQTTMVRPDLTAGVYFIRLLDNGRVRTQKLVINQ